MPGIFSYIFLSSQKQVSLGVSVWCELSGLRDVKRSRAEVDRLFKEKIPKLLIPFPLEFDGGGTVRKREKG